MPAAPNRAKSQVADVGDLARRVDALERSVAVPVFPVLTADPVLPLNGQVWIRSDTNRLCYVVNGIVLHLLGT